MSPTARWIPDRIWSRVVVATPSLAACYLFLTAPSWHGALLVYLAGLPQTWLWEMRRAPASDIPKTVLGLLAVNIPSCFMIPLLLCTLGVIVPLYGVGAGLLWSARRIRQHHLVLLAIALNYGLMGNRVPRSVVKATKRKALSKGLLAEVADDIINGQGNP